MMRSIMAHKAAALMCLCISLFAAGANAQNDYPRNITFNWTNADAFTDGTPILVEDELYTLAFCSQGSNVVLDYTRVPGFATPGEVQTHVFADVIPSPGTYVCNLFHVVGPAMSDPSNTGTVRYTGRPSPPVTVIITAE